MTSRVMILGAVVVVVVMLVPLIVTSSMPSFLDVVRNFDYSSSAAAKTPRSPSAPPFVHAAVDTSNNQPPSARLDTTKSSSLPRNPSSSSSPPSPTTSSSRSSSVRTVEDGHQDMESSWWKDFESDGDTTDENTEDDDGGNGNDDDDNDGVGEQIQIPCGLIVGSLPAASTAYSDLDKINDSNVNVLPLTKAIIDTSATKTLIHRRIIEHTYPQLKTFVKQRHQQQHRRHQGSRTENSGSIVQQLYLPAGILSMRMDDTTIPSPTLWVVNDYDDDGADDLTSGDVDLWLGLDFLRRYAAVIDVQNEEVRLSINSQEHIIPMIRPRPILNLFPDSADDEL